MTGRESPSAASLIEMLADGDSWQSWDDTPPPVAVPAGYADQLRRAAERSGADESVRTGRVRIGGWPVVLIVSEFGFLGGSIGRVAGHRITTAIRRATRDGVPVVGLPCSGGTRMQEGTPAFLEMAAISGAVLDHRAAGLLYLTYLRHPTTGGVFASWGSLGQLTWAQPGALIGFLGPRVVAGLAGAPMPDDVQRAENLAAHALIDDVVALGDLGDRIHGVLAALGDRGGSPRTAEPRVPVGDHLAEPAAEPAGGPDRVWTAVTATRSAGRPGVHALIDTEDTAILGDTGPIVLALSRFGAATVLVVGQDAERQRAGALIGPAHLRMVRRALTFAAELRVPVVTVIDTPGAELSVAAEEGGLAGEIARCTAELISLPVITVSVLLGQGAGAAALALFPTDRRIALDDAWLSPLPPEGASLIVHHDTKHAAEVASGQRILAAELAGAGVIDRIVPSADAASIARLVHAAIAEELDAIAAPDPASRVRVPVPGSGQAR
ncbi:carboxyl transferase domain-containing protein [Gordonia sp. DT30]|uniref:carboxyl transferase domain-containing protein n=1 Tax=Gordonia sp. DT30 TaxID=3416546 RepID=UPI003CF92CB8